MIKFFRKIRQNMIKENKVSNYLLYAFGEIILVVIGILLALQINSWNQNRLNSLKEKRIIQDISEELQFNRFLQESGSQRMKEVVAASERLLDIISNPNSRPPIEQINLDIHKLTWIWMSATPTTIYDALSGSGDFGLISSPQLRKKLADLKSNQEKLLQFEEIQSRFVDQQLRPFLNRSMDRTAIRSIQKAGKLSTTHHPSQFATTHDDLLGNREFSNLLIDLQFLTRRLLNTYSRIEIDINKIDSIAIKGNPDIQIKPYVPYGGIK